MVSVAEVLGDGFAGADVVVSDPLGAGVPSLSDSLGDVLTELLGAGVVSLADSLWDDDSPADGLVAGALVELLAEADGDGDVSPVA
ncbi:hypothetical protein [Streptomyces pactum]|uniref:hypothetical protein n=1 Tax=Streptomyces pactum TaxID=68249 RepID=UPI002D21E6C4|nr:hypothetical protein [Streptomyces pactum]